MKNIILKILQNCAARSITVEREDRLLSLNCKFSINTVSESGGKMGCHKQSCWQTEEMRRKGGRMQWVEQMGGLEVSDNDNIGKS